MSGSVGGVSESVGECVGERVGMRGRGAVRFVCGVGCGFSLAVLIDKRGKGVVWALQHGCVERQCGDRQKQRG